MARLGVGGRGARRAPALVPHPSRRGSRAGRIAGASPLGSPLRKGATMKAMKKLVSKLVRDEQGGEVLEYALIAGLIVVAAIAAITSVGSKVLAKWTSVNASM